MWMLTKKRKKRNAAVQLATALRAYNALAPLSRQRGDQEIDAVYAALEYGDGCLDFVLQQLIVAAGTVQEGNAYTSLVRTLLKRAKAVLSPSSFTEKQ